jgi:hypothetical protein
MKLPGGLAIIACAEPKIHAGDYCVTSSVLRKEFNFRNTNGALDLQLHENFDTCVTNEQSRPVWISRLLNTILKDLGNEVMESNSQSLEQVRDLSVADRQFILLQWRLRHSGHEEWLTTQCPACDALYDFPIDWRVLPIKPAAPEYPFTTVIIANREICFRVPNGRDQEIIAELVRGANAIEDSSELSLALARRLIVADSEELKAELSDLLEIGHLEVIEAAIEFVAPELADHLTLECPECATEKSVSLDLYRGLLKPIDYLLDDVHRLASNYHWNEKDILDMPTQRRLSYLQRLDKDRRFSGVQGR